MKNTRMHLHLSRKKALVLVFLTVVLLLALNVVALYTLDSNSIQLNSLLNSDYLYSATMIPASETDDYICFKAGISFKLKEDAPSSINADIVMQSMGVQYTEAVNWNTNELSTYGIAISSNLAREYGLNIGDSLYSKHIVNDVVIEYRIEQIIPDVMCIRINDNGMSGDGVIIMGYDEEYVDYISNVHLVYTKEPVNTLFGYSQGTLTDIVYRNNEITVLLKAMVPYIVVNGICSILVSIGLVFFLKKEISYNFKRLMIAGFSAKELNVAYNRCVMGMSMLSVFLAFVITLLAFLFYYASSLMFLYYSAILLLEAVVIVIVAHIFKRLLWRK